MPTRRAIGVSTLARSVGVLAILGATLGPVAAQASTSPSPTGASSSPSAADSSTQPKKLLLILDVSGSMKEPDASGETKMKASQAALTSVVESSLPSTTQVGLRVFGAEVVGGKPTEEACADTQSVHPLTPLDRAGLVKLINGAKPKGETPLGYTLTQAINDLGTDGERNIVMISDGKESCTPDPCPAIRDVIGSGINFRLDTVGVAVDAKARDQLTCLAEAGHGEYYDVQQMDELVGALGKRMAAATPTPVATTPTVTPQAAAPQESDSNMGLIAAAVGGLVLIGGGAYAAARRRSSDAGRH